MIVTEYMENGALDTYLKVIADPFITSYLMFCCKRIQRFTTKGKKQVKF